MARYNYGQCLSTLLGIQPPKALNLRRGRCAEFINMSIFLTSERNLGASRRKLIDADSKSNSWSYWISVVLAVLGQELVLNSCQFSGI